MRITPILVLATCLHAQGLFSPDRPTGTVGSSQQKNLSISPAATATFLPSVSGPGLVTDFCLWSNQAALQVNIAYDGESPASTQILLSDLLGDHYSDSQPAFRGNWIISSNAGGNNPGGCFRLPMPFTTSIAITLTNNASGTAVITGYVVYETGVANTWSYTQRLHMTVLNQRAINPNAETDMVNVSPGKKGLLAGFGWVYDGCDWSGSSCLSDSANPRSAPLEGAFKIYFDGSSTPGFLTSGTEDMFGMGWYFRLFNGFSAGCCNAGGTLAPGGGDNLLTISTNDTWGAQRFFIRDPKKFNSALRMSWTCGNTSNGVNFTGKCILLSTVYWYSES